MDIQPRLFGDLMLYLIVILVACYGCIFLAMPTADLSWSGLWSHVVRGRILSPCIFLSIYDGV